MVYLTKLKENINVSTVVSVVFAIAVMGVGSFLLKKLGIKPVTDAVNVATKGAKK